MMPRARLALGVLLVAATAVSPTLPAAGAAPVSVVAAEDFWGSIARELGGERAEVTSLISDPATEPHDYEPRPSDGIAVAKANVAIVNGIGYDRWMSALLAANPSPNRKVVDVGDVVGAEDGDNPHQWYSPPSVEAVVHAITAALKQADPAGAAYFESRGEIYRRQRLERYHDLRARIRAQYGGVPVGASESIVAPLAEDLGLSLITPASFIAAIADGNEPTARDKAIVDRQITDRQIAVFVYNAQNSTPDVDALVDQARKAGIPVVAVTETIVPPGAAFADWQADQLQRLADALAASGGGTATPVGATEALPARPAAPNGGLPGWIVLLAGAAFIVGGVAAGASTLRRSGTPLARP